MTAPHPLPTPRSLPELPPLHAATTTAWRRAATPRAVAATPARIVLGALLLLLPTSFVPWQQSAPGSGRVIAYDPASRPQTLEAPVSGRVLAWKVREGQRVRAGDVLVELQDNDPDYVDRLLTERHLLTSRFEASSAKLAAAEAKRTAAQLGRDAQLASANAKVQAVQDKLAGEREVLAGAEAAAATADVQAERAVALFREGLRSLQSVEDYGLKADLARAKLEESRAKVAAAEADLAASRADREKLQQDASGKLAEADGDLQSAVALLADDEAKILKLDTQLSRQDRRLVDAPIDGIVARIYGGQGGEQVKENEELILLVPDTADRAVEIWLDGNDAALVRPGQQVRLQFEGWPALQFSGWPSVAVGTFGGRVDFVDPTDDGKGQFRVFVVQDATEAPWPDATWLRQGVRTKGWVMLSTVPLAYEAWRQLNDFPPTVPAPTESKGVGGPAEPGEAGKAGKSWRPK